MTRKQFSSHWHLDNGQAKQHLWRKGFDSAKGIARLKLASELVSALVILLLGTDCQAAASAPLHLAWSAPRQCPQQGEVMSRIQKLLGTSPLREELEPLYTRAGIEPFKGQFRLTLWIQDGAMTGTRSITSTSCQSLGDAAAVVLSLLIRQRRELGRTLSNDELSGGSELDAGAGSSPVAENPLAADPASTQPGAEATPRKDVEAATSPDRATATRSSAPDANPNRARTRDEQPKDRLSPPAKEIEPGRRWRLLLAAPVAHLDFWTLPKVSRGVGLALGLTYDEWYFFTSVGLFAAQHVHFGGAREFDAEFRSRSLSGWICRAWESKPFRFAPCAVVDASTVEASASSERLASRSRTATWFSAGGGALSSIHIGQLVAIAARAAGRLTLNRPEFVLDGVWGEQRIHRAPTGSVELTLGCDWFF